MLIYYTNVYNDKTYVLSMNFVFRNVGFKRLLKNTNISENEGITFDKLVEFYLLEINSQV